MASTTPSRDRNAGETITRMTKEGRKLTYCLKVIQEPERARACGSGAKSSADRRPVDPPPVVELKIYEEKGRSPEGEELRSDITFSYNANFFLFATLEVARPMAHGRVQPAAPQIPVLTGMPVSGMAYLDRPTEAGYFIFPDLSVRHEGKYRLSFNLYEETKEAKDVDAEPNNDPSKPKIPPGAMARGTETPDSSFDWRMEVKSQVFTVYSAKKFPGLAESTVLSRTVAEQGCRVRIRRDVRMRRRDNKNGGDFDDAEEDYARTGRSVEPSVHDPYRERSMSNHSDDRQPYPEQRRMSGDYSSQPYEQYTPSPVAPHASAPQGGYLSFGGHPSNQYQAPQSQFAQPAPPAPAPPPPPYQSAPAPYQPSPQYRPPVPPPGQYGYDRQPYPQSAYPSNPPREREVYESEQYRRASYAAPAPQGGLYPHANSDYHRNNPSASYSNYPPRPYSPRPNGITPLNLPAIEPRHDSLSSPPGQLPPVRNMAPPLPSPNYERPPERHNSYSQYSAPIPPPPDSVRAGKRSFDSVFPSSSSNQPLYNGMRPSSSHGNQGIDDDEESMSLEQLKMSYKRADGTSYSRELPVLD